MSGSPPEAGDASPVAPGGVGPGRWWQELAVRACRSETALAAAVLAILVVMQWAPFGLHVGPTLDDWYPPVALDAGIGLVPPASPMHQARPLLWLPHLIAFGLTRDSFLGLNLVQALSMFGKALLAFLVVRRLAPGAGSVAIATATLFLVYPANTEAYWNTALAGHFTQLFFLLAVWTLLGWDASSGVVRALAIGGSLAIVCGSSEVAFPLIAFTPLLLLARRPRDWRRLAGAAVAWWAAPLLFALNYGRVMAAGSRSYQRDVLVARGPLEALRVLLEGAGRALWTCWRDGLLAPAGQAARLIGLVSAVLLALALWAVHRWPVERAHDPRAPTIGAQGLLVAGLAVILLGYAPFVPSTAAASGRAMFYPALGAALCVAVVIDQLGKRSGRWLAAALLAALVGLGAQRGVERHAFYAHLSLQQQQLVAAVARQLGSVRPGTGVVLVGTPPVDFAAPVFEWALRYFLADPSVITGFCEPSAGPGCALAPEGFDRPVGRSIRYHQLVLFDHLGWHDTACLVEALPARLEPSAAARAAYAPRRRLLPGRSPRRLATALDAGVVDRSGWCRTPPSSFDFGFDRDVLDGSGWEPHAAGRSSQWTVAGTSRLWYPIAADHDLKLTIEVNQFLIPEARDGLAARVNGVAIPISRRDGAASTLYTGTIPAAAVAGDRLRTELALQVPRLVTPRSLGMGLDERPLGLSFDSVRVEPIVRQSRLRFEFDRDSATGSGWEPHAAGQSVKWSTSRRATLGFLLAEDRDFAVTAAVSYYLAEDVAASLRLSVNGVAVDLRRRFDGGRTLYTGIVPAAAVARRPGEAELAFEVSRLVSPKALEVGEDPRSLGLLFDWLTLEAVTPPPSAGSSAPRPPPAPAAPR